MIRMQLTIRIKPAAIARVAFDWTQVLSRMATSGFSACDCRQGSRIASKGTNEFGGQTKAETNFDGQIMLDVGRVMGGPKGTFKVGLEYQYWKNKFGNDHAGPAGQGAFAKTPMIRAAYHWHGFKLAGQAGGEQPGSFRERCQERATVPRGFLKALTQLNPR